MLIGRLQCRAVEGVECNGLADGSAWRSARAGFLAWAAERGRGATRTGFGRGMRTARGAATRSGFTCPSLCSLPQTMLREKPRPNCAAISDADKPRPYSSVMRPIAAGDQRPGLASGDATAPGRPHSAIWVSMLVSTLITRPWFFRRLIRRCTASIVRPVSFTISRAVFGPVVSVARTIAGGWWSQ